MSDLSFDAPLRLLVLLAVLALVVVYVLVQRRRSAYAVRFTDVDLLASVAPKVPGWQRHLPATFLVGALVLMATAFAKPSAAVEVPQEAATVVIAIDTSASMQATDVAPNRFEAAKAAAAAFVGELPDTFDVGLVSFSQAARVEVSPTEDHESVVTAIDGLQLGEGTAIGEAVATAVATAAQGATADDVEPAPARVVLLSDGANTQGRSIENALRASVSAGVPVSTIAYGTPQGTVTVQGQTVPVPVDGPALQKVAEATGGQAYEAESSDELAEVYSDISDQVGTTTEQREISAAVAGLALLLALAAAAMSLAWSPRMP